MADTPDQVGQRNCEARRDSRDPKSRGCTGLKMTLRIRYTKPDLGNEWLGGGFGWKERQGQDHRI